jgi:hypothetical protein
MDDFEDDLNHVSAQASGFEGDSYSSAVFRFKKDQPTR